VASTPPKRGTRRTIHDVAEAAGVSFSTVSLVLNGKGNISRATRERVFRIANELGYSANPMARALRGKSSRILGVSMRSLDSDGVYSRPGVDYFARLFSSVWAAALNSGYGVVLTGRDHTLTEQLTPLWVDGYIIEDPLEEDPFVDRLIVAGVPIVTIGWPPGREDAVSWVSTSDSTESTVVLQHLRACGSETIALISGVERTSWHMEGERTYLDFMHALGIEPRLIRVSEAEGVEGGERAGRMLLTDGPRPDAVLCHTGRHAAGVVAAAREIGLRVPDDLLVAACNDSEPARSAVPPITTIDLRPELLGEQAVELMLEILAEAGRPRHRIIEGELLLRGSTSRGALDRA